MFHLVRNQSYSGFGGPWQRQNKQIVREQIHPEFAGRSYPQDRKWRVSDNHTPAWSSFPVKGTVFCWPFALLLLLLYILTAIPIPGLFCLLPFSFLDVLLAGALSPSSGMQDRDYYSTFHKTPNRKKFTKKAWNDFTRHSTQQALSELASTPEFTDWIMEHADRIQLLPSDDSSDETVGSESDSTNEDVVGSGSRFSFLNW